MTVRQAAQIMNVSERSVYLAGKLLRSGREDLVAAVERGEMSLHNALKRAYPEPPRSDRDKLVRAWNRASEEQRDYLLDYLIWYAQEESE